MAGIDAKARYAGETGSLVTEEAWFKSGASFSMPLSRFEPAGGRRAAALFIELHK